MRMRKQPDMSGGSVDSDDYYLAAVFEDREGDSVKELVGSSG